MMHFEILNSNLCPLVNFWLYRFTCFFYPVPADSHLRPAPLRPPLRIFILALPHTSVIDTPKFRKKNHRYVGKILSIEALGWYPLNGLFRNFSLIQSQIDNVQVCTGVYTVQGYLAW